MDGLEQSPPACHQHAAEQGLAPYLWGNSILAGTSSCCCPSTPRAVPSAWHCRRNAEHTGQRAGRGLALPPAAQARGGSRVTIPAAAAPPQQVPGPHFHQECPDQEGPEFPLQPRLLFLAFPSRQHSLICPGMMRHPHVGTQRSSCCSSRAKAKIIVPSRGHPAALEQGHRVPSLPSQGRICPLPRTLGQGATTPAWTLSLREGRAREGAAEPIQHHSSPWKGRGRSWLSVPSGTNLSVSADANIS